LTYSIDPVAASEQLLVEQAGGYLRNVIREPFVTCSVCATPVDGYECCYRCSQVRTTMGLADVVAPLVYGIERRQSGIVLRHYKDDVSAEAKEQHSRVVRRLLYLGLMRHQNCIEKHIGQRITARVAVPSLKHRPGMHPFTAIAAAMKAVDSNLALVPAAGAMDDRVVSGDQFEVVFKRSLDGQHVLVLDDTHRVQGAVSGACVARRRRQSRECHGHR
jgi:hypothetical protein